MLFVSFFVVVPLQYWLIGINWYGLFAVLIPVYVFVTLPAISVLAGDTQDFLARSAKVQWGLWLCVYALSNAPALLMLLRNPQKLIPKEELGELKNATAEQATGLFVVPTGSAVWWPQLDDGLYLPDFLEHRWGKERRGVAA